MEEEIELKLGWQRYVTPGHVWVARLNTFTLDRRRRAVRAGGQCSMGRVRQHMELPERLSAAQSAPPTWWERFKGKRRLRRSRARSAVCAFPARNLGR